ncbi:MAG: AAA family ATPase [Deltaproteobacteria bacterium]|nr:AAA family ATPase [Deltaproteobacteria bacterium]MBI3294178.1 AAA family ATPase [Deltaproteobacteria bacterium]
MSRSFFLFGARSTGKSTLIRQLPAFDERHYVDLLDDEVLNEYSRDPKKLEMLASESDWVFIDEVQKSTKLLNTVHKLIEKKKTKFALTGSSARKLKRGGANLLGGRANVFHLYPLTAREAFLSLPGPQDRRVRGRSVSSLGRISSQSFCLNRFQ